MRMRSRTHLQCSRRLHQHLICRSVTCIYIFRSRNTEISLKFKSNSQKKLVHKDVVYYLQNALKPTYEHLEFEKFFRGLYPRTPVQRGREWEGRNRGEEVEREGRAEGWEGKRIEGKGREWKGRGEEGGKEWGRDGRPGGRAPPKFLG
jgi:hypothetical protein